MPVAPPRRDDTPVGIIRPIPRGEIAGVDDLVDFDRPDGRGRSPAALRSGRRRSSRRRTHVGRRLLLLFVVAAAAYYGVSLFQVWSTGRADQTRPVDAIVVMGAAQYDGEPSPQLAARLDHAADLYAEGLAPMIVVTGGKQPDDRFTEAEASAAYLEQHGVPASAITLENEGRTTYESLVNVADLLVGPDVHRVLIVTDPFHSLRSRLIAQHVGFEAYVSPTPSSVVTGVSELRREIVEAAGISIGRLIGFGRI